MDENRRGYDLKGRDSFPRGDGHLVEPEVTRDEIIGGQRIVAFPATPPHANQQSRLAYLLRAHVAPGYIASTDLLAAKGSPAIREKEAAAEARGEARGMARSILTFLEARGIPLNEAQRQRILACRDLDRLDRWSLQAALASSAGELTLES